MNIEQQKTTYNTIAVFGADGRTGVPLVKELQERGYRVIASVYSEEGKHRLPGGVEVVVGDITDAHYVDSLVARADAVISVVGHIKGGDPRMQTRGMEHIVTAMQTHGKRRVVSLTGTGVRHEGDTPSLIDRAANTLISFIDPQRISDGIAHAEVLKTSGLDWTILRVLKLTEKEYEGSEYALTSGGPAELSTPRAKVAHMLVEVLADTRWFQHMPVSSRA